MLLGEIEEQCIVRDKLRRARKCMESMHRKEIKPFEKERSALNQALELRESTEDNPVPLSLLEKDIARYKSLIAERDQTIADLKGRTNYLKHELAL